MSLRSDGAYRCDRCGADVGNGSVDQAVIVSDVQGGSVRVLHFCREPRDGAPHGCAGRLLSPSMLADYLKEHP
jgi:hypothetical protein